MMWYMKVFPKIIVCHVKVSSGCMYQLMTRSLSSAGAAYTSNICQSINKAGTSVILVEQNAEMALRLARHGYVLETGSVALEGEADGLMDNPHVRKAYLGI